MDTDRVPHLGFQVHGEQALVEICVPVPTHEERAQEFDRAERREALADAKRAATPFYEAVEAAGDEAAASPLPADVGVADCVEAARGHIEAALGFPQDTSTDIQRAFRCLVALGNYSESAAPWVRRCVLGDQNAHPAGQALAEIETDPSGSVREFSEWLTSGAEVGEKSMTLPAVARYAESLGDQARPLVPGLSSHMLAGRETVKIGNAIAAIDADGVDATTMEELLVTPLDDDELNSRKRRAGLVILGGQDEPDEQIVERVLPWLMEKSSGTNLQTSVADAFGGKTLSQTHVASIARLLASAQDDANLFYLQKVIEAQPPENLAILRAPLIDLLAGGEHDHFAWNALVHVGVGRNDVSALRNCLRTLSSRDGSSLHGLSQVVQAVPPQDLTALQGDLLGLLEDERHDFQASQMLQARGPRRKAYSTARKDFRPKGRGRWVHHRYHKRCADVRAGRSRSSTQASPQASW